MIPQEQADLADILAERFDYDSPGRSADECRADAVAEAGEIIAALQAKGYVILKD